MLILDVEYVLMKGRALVLLQYVVVHTQFKGDKPNLVRYQKVVASVLVKTQDAEENSIKGLLYSLCM